MRDFDEIATARMRQMVSFFASEEISEESPACRGGARPYRVRWGYGLGEYGLEAERWKERDREERRTRKGRSDGGSAAPRHDGGVKSAVIRRSAVSRRSRERRARTASAEVGGGGDRIAAASARGGFK
ncbi:hypothetical protein Scep_024484 [Stephania cephalantha]|uniref:Uncharacterized protein n=1 Tax=Stephania cephalantha TaxID=152367 RepID=A0AAP0HYI7_9MAGN